MKFIDASNPKDFLSLQTSFQNEELEMIEWIGSSMSEKVKYMLESLSDINLDSISNSIQENFVKTDFTSIKSKCNLGKTISGLESMKSFVEAIKVDFVYLKNNSFSLRASLRRYNIQDLIILYLKEKDHDKRRFIWDYIIRQEKIKKYNVLIKKINRRLKRILFYLITCIQRNLRLLIRKIQSFHFKNLDDYHGNTIIENLQFKVIQPSVSILNNSNNEKKYFR
ncbi:hypothetical protein [Winogradskyella forsetii]|uniref:hypothetical protein n=1 Tax=Winogradskyella forsetii TaxID=2686077 RepID=UPI0015BD34BC|nr:hypothetical protein [Winogradskyella forsetii]